MRRLTSIALRCALALGVAAGLVATTGPTAAAAGCGSLKPGSYFCDVTYTPNGLILIYTNLHSDHHEYAHWKVVGSTGQEVWFDRSTNPSAGWDPYVNKTYIVPGDAGVQDSASFNSPIYDGSPWQARACTWTSGKTYCSKWH
ncbi:hypothetical protein ACIQM0_10730 [Streptomyces sp. NPDC091387]|uniref:hypothetical protein n=1 Tax=Streptomyces sp. NPDC091387 TaxID=3365998 RepID=UPI0037FA1239